MTATFRRTRVMGKPPPWTPLDLGSKLVVYLSAAQVASLGTANAADIGTWLNQAGGLGGAPTLTPQFESASGPGGGPCVYFAAGEYFTFGDLMAGATSGEAFATVKADTEGAATGGWVFGTSGNFTHFPLSGSWEDDFGTNTRRGYNPTVLATTWIRYNVWSAANDWKMTINEETGTSTGTNTVTFPERTAIGNYYNGGGGTANLRYGCVVMTNQKLTAPERARLLEFMTANPSGHVASAPTLNSPVAVATSPLLWLDASDSASFSYSSGAVVSKWADKSGRGNHMVQRTTAKQPTRTGTQNGLPVVAFGAGCKMRAQPTITQPVTIFVVFRKTGANQTFEALPLTQSGGSGGSYAQPIDGHGNARYFSNDSSPTVGAGLTMAAQTSWMVLSQQFSGTAYEERKDGAVVLSGSHARGITTNGSQTVLFSRDDEGTQLVGDCAEVLVFPQLNSTDRATVEAYLKAKWGTP